MSIKFPKNEPEIELGSKVRDKLTGFEGTVIVRCDWLYGCRRYGVIASKLQEGKPVDTQYFDEPQLEMIIDNIAEQVDKTGGPREHEYSRRKDPTR